MTLIPMMSALIATPKGAAAPAGPVAFGREAYNPGAGHRPVAAMLAIGLPAALVVAVALSPMIVKPEPQIAPQTWETIFAEKPKPEKPPEATEKAKEKPRAASTTETVDRIIPTPTSTDNVVDTGPKTIDPVIPDFKPPVAPPLDPPKPALVLAKLDPNYAGSFQPDYPASEQRREIEGLTKVRVLIGTDGRVKAVELVSTDSPGFFEETKRRALAKWRFKPATRGGVAEESWQVMTVRFQIKKA